MMSEAQRTLRFTFQARTTVGAETPFEGYTVDYKQLVAELEESVARKLPDGATVLSIDRVWGRCPVDGCDNEVEMQTAVRTGRMKFAPCHQHCPPPSWTPHGMYDCIFCGRKVYSGRPD